MPEVTDQLEVFKGEKIALNTDRDLPDQCLIKTDSGLALVARTMSGFRFWLPWLGTSYRAEGTSLAVKMGRVYLNKGPEAIPGEAFTIRENVVAVRKGSVAGPYSGAAPLVPQDYEERIAEALHVIADDNDWCREFDDLMDEVGLPTRVRDLVSTISVQVVVTLGDSGVHQSLNEGELPGVSIAEVEVKGDVVVEHHWSGLDDDEPDVDNYDVSRLVDELLSDHYVEVVDWEVVETRPDGQ